MHMSPMNRPDGRAFSLRPVTVTLKCAPHAKSQSSTTKPANQAKGRFLKSYVCPGELVCNLVHAPTNNQQCTNQAKGRFLKKIMCAPGPDMCTAESL